MSSNLSKAMDEWALIAFTILMPTSVGMTLVGALTDHSQILSLATGCGCIRLISFNWSPCSSTSSTILYLELAAFLAFTRNSSSDYSLAFRDRLVFGCVFQGADSGETVPIMCLNYWNCPTPCHCTSLSSSFKASLERYRNADRTLCRNVGVGHIGWSISIISWI